MTAKDYYKTYQADDTISDLSHRLLFEINLLNPSHALDFGCGTGKHSHLLDKLGVSTIALDLSFFNIQVAKFRHELPCVVCADEQYLRNIANCDVVFTCSVMDHIELIDEIIAELKRIANKAVFLAETNSYDTNYYYQHDYEAIGFEKIDYSWTSPDDKATYEIWKWIKS